jgi:uncharacterized protein (TIGR03905 family)
MEHFTYIPSGVCSKKYEIYHEDGLIKDIQIIGGCPGNLLGIKSLITNMKIDDAIAKLEGIKCGYKQTSCPDQIAQALKTIKR